MQEHNVAMTSTFRVPESDVVLEAFADETIAVNLAVGRYYSLDPSGAQIFDLLAGGHALDAIVEHLAHRHDADCDAVGTAVLDFTARLLDEGLIAPVPERGPGPAVPVSEPASAAFSVPSMSVYTDMEDLLLLDPIHDVDETGWPVRADASDPPPSDHPGPG